ncbi:MULTISPECIES: phosphotransferase family protein [Micromonospora]|uniref:Aminoglycoside phosphotransferase family protein n=1 Tax=Micromonospora solifontis TaxID=2487138 RepID=A0ABX9WK99_9ACTN|nr:MULTISPECIES: aminoglycoside phosphotransferase family protein [Micromonospora]NES12452.1 aminoglycoside phosphotransferase family protein [Micromonospora sp. PPF5-17B]NES36368.1 aminoglycoside phosphotransferase family protein [Micromonospora solifontis]NES57786.1 aminoglycoside phosphotransferase family protein [Micromonospora sp. PPF5-6]RNL99606.1 aminoglycoside phosphotransferase family protein [Micromonospora solifontis]
MAAVPRISLPPVPYDATAVRPDWAALPAGLRDGIAARLGGPPAAVRLAGGGFTRGFAAVLTGPDGDRVFVKAAALDGQRHLVDWYFHEARILARLPAGLPVPRPRWALTDAGWYAVGLTAVAGRTPELPWHPEALDAALTGYAEVAAALADPPAELVALGLPRLDRLARDDILWWGEVAAGREPAPELPPWAPLPELVRLESRLPGYADTAGLAHGDLRVDNVLLDADGRAWFCDWTWLCHGPAWFDLVSLLITGYASGLDADAAFAGHPAATGAPADALDVTLAALAGYFLTGAAAGPSTASPHLRAHQRWSGEQALAWLAARQHWT